MANTITRLITLLYGQEIGHDFVGNIYYESRRKTLHGRKRRWVVYVGEAEASLVPAGYSAWLRHTVDVFPVLSSQDEGKTWVGNTTGTPQADLPPGHLARLGQRSKATGDYEAWSP